MMGRLTSLVLLLAVATPAAAQPRLTEVVIGPAKLEISPLPLKPGAQITVQGSFHQGLTFAPIGQLGCSGPTDTSSSPCDGSKSLGVTLWRDSPSGVRSAQPVGGASIPFAPPAFYTVVNQAFSGISVPQIEPNEFLTVELIFFDKTVKVTGGIGLVAIDVPRVLGFRRFKWACRSLKKGVPPACRYVEVPQ